MHVASTLFHFKITSEKLANLLIASLQYKHTACNAICLLCLFRASCKCSQQLAFKEEESLNFYL